jgi:hypothetical protein
MRDQHIHAIVNMIADYRRGEIPPPTHQHVERWVQQFPNQQDEILAELAHVLGATYITEADLRGHVEDFVADTGILGASPRDFWLSAHLIDDQGGGTSQRHMLGLVRAAIAAKYGHVPEPVAPQTFIYIDDISYSGNRVRQDIVRWINGNAPHGATLLVYTIAAHAYGHWSVSRKITDAIRASGKSIRFRWPTSFMFEDRGSETNSSDVLRPAATANAAVAAYVAQLSRPVIWRNGTNAGVVFSSNAGRSVLEQEFLRAGIEVRQRCPNLPAPHRPLGFTNLEMLGFGSTIVTYRNCPNNAPLALWAGYPWYPLFPRRNN